MRVLFVFAFACCVALGAAQWVHPFDFPQDNEVEGEVWMVVEIPAGSFTKYEIDKQTGLVVADRFQSMPVAYPCNYGTVSSTYADDGDNLDIMVFTREPLVPGTMIKVRVIGVLPMIDGGEQDDKLIAVPTDRIDPTYSNIRDISDLPEIERERIVAFFRVYKDLPAGRKAVELAPLKGRDEAIKILNEALAAYQRRKTDGN